jgi:hypothetical protein
MKRELLQLVFGATMAATCCAQEASAPAYPPLAPMPPPAPPYDVNAYAKAEKCMRAYAVRFAATAALASDVAEASLEACHKERSAAALARASGNARYVTIATLQSDEPDLRRAALMAILEARYAKAH